MGRRAKTSPAEDLFHIVAYLPWWAGVVLAIVTYLLLHRWAAQPATVSTQAGQLGLSVIQVMGRAVAGALQYALPLIFLMAAGASAWKRKQRKALAEQVTQSDSASVLNGMTWQQFEQLVGEGFRLRGYRVTELGGAGPDGGVDLALTKGSEKFLVQCKQWRAMKVGVSVVRELYGAMAASGAAGGFVVTSGRFTQEAVAFASGRNIELIDGPQLHAMIGGARNVGATDAAAPFAHTLRPPPTTRQPAKTPQAAPACPHCGKPMVKRTAKRGSNTGQDFWGCTTYPGCRGTRAIDTP